MWIIELSFSTADAATAGERLAARPAHRARLTELHGRGVVRAAGPFADNSGALIVLDVPDRAAAEAIVEADPYFRTPGVTVTALREWSPFLT
jgi:uncharacterized protein